MRLSAKNMWMQLYCHFFGVHNSCINDNECYRVCQGFWPSLSKNWYNNFLACFICKLDSSQVEIKIKIRRNLLKKPALAGVHGPMHGPKHGPRAYEGQTPSHTVYVWKTKCFSNCANILGQYLNKMP